MKSPGSEYGNNMGSRMGEHMGEKMEAAGHTPFVEGRNAGSRKGKGTPFVDNSALTREAKPQKPPKARLKPVFEGSVPGPGSHKPKQP